MLAACGGGGGGGGGSSGGGGGAGGGGTTATTPIIATQPVSATVGIGQPVTFTVGAVGTAPLSFQWLRGGQPISGANAASFTIASALQADSGAVFSVQVSNTVGSVTSANATLTVQAQAGIALVAGNIGGSGYLDRTGPAARFLAASNVAVDAAGNTYVADQSTIRKIDTTGAVTTVAGSPITTGSTNGSTAVATFRALSGIAIDGAGNLYVTDRASHLVRKVTAAGVVSTVAGTANVPGSADGTGTAAQFNAPGGIAVDGAGNLYVADTTNDTIRKITAAGVVTTLAGSAGNAGTSDGTGSVARFNAPANVAVDGTGNVYVADRGSDTIRVVTAAGAVTTLAGSAGIAATLDGTGTAARFNQPTGIALDASGNVYVAEGGGDVIRRIASGGVVTTIAGTAAAAGSTDGAGAAARFSQPGGLAASAAGVLTVADTGNATIRRVAVSGTTSTFAGTAAIIGSADGTGSQATFNGPFGVAVDATGTIYIGDFLNATIRKVTGGGVVTTLAGSPGQTGSADGTGAAALFRSTEALAVDGAGNVYVADRDNHTIRKVTAAGVVTTLAGAAGQPGSADGTGGAARFAQPTALTIDAAGNLYVLDANPTVRKVTPAGVVTTIAGAAGRIGSVDGPGPSAASFNLPQGITIDTAGNLFVADSGNATIRKIDTAGNVTTIAGVAGQSSIVDGPAATARFAIPFGIGIDPAGNLYVADITPATIVVGNSGGTHGSHTLRKVDTAGSVTTIAGVADNVGGTLLGALPGHLDSLSAIAVDRSGNIYGGDANGVVRITP